MKKTILLFALLSVIIWSTYYVSRTFNNDQMINETPHRSVASISKGILSLDSKKINSTSGVYPELPTQLEEQITITKSQRLKQDLNDYMSEKNLTRLDRLSDEQIFEINQKIKKHDRFLVKKENDETELRNGTQTVPQIDFDESYLKSALLKRHQENLKQNEILQNQLLLLSQKATEISEDEFNNETH